MSRPLLRLSCRSGLTDLELARRMEVSRATLYRHLQMQPEDLKLGELLRFARAVGLTRTELCDLLTRGYSDW